MAYVIKKLPWRGKYSKWIPKIFKQNIKSEIIVHGSYYIQNEPKQMSNSGLGTIVWLRPENKYWLCRNLHNYKLLVCWPERLRKFLKVTQKVHGTASLKPDNLYWDSSILPLHFFLPASLIPPIIILVEVLL